MSLNNASLSKQSPGWNESLHLSNCWDLTSKLSSAEKWAQESLVLFKGKASLHIVTQVTPTQRRESPSPTGADAALLKAWGQRQRFLASV